MERRRRKPQNLKEEEIQEQFVPYATSRLESLRRTLAQTVSLVSEDDVVNAMKQDPVSKTHVSQRIDELIESSLSNEREGRVRELEALLVSRDSAILSLKKERESKFAQQQAELIRLFTQIRDGLSKITLKAPETKAIVEEVRRILKSEEEKQQQKLNNANENRIINELTRGLKQASEMLDVSNAALKAEQMEKLKILNELRENVSLLREATSKALEEQRKWIARKVVELKGLIGGFENQRIRGQIECEKWKQRALIAEESIKSSNEVVESAEERILQLTKELEQIRKSNGVIALKQSREQRQLLQKIENGEQNGIQLRDELETTKKELESTSKRNEANEERIEQLTKELEQIKKSRELKQTNEQKQLIQKLEASEENERQLREELETTRKALENAQTNVTQITREKVQIARELETAKRKAMEVESLQASQIEMKRHAENVSEELENAKKRADIAETKVRDLLKELENTRKQAENDKLSAECDARDRERELSSVSGALRRLQQQFTNENLSDKVLRDVAISIPGITLPISATINQISQLLKQSIQQLINKDQKLATENTELLARASKAESYIEGLRIENGKIKRLLEVQKQEAEKHDREFAASRVREHELSEKLQRSQEIVRQIKATDKVISGLHSQLQQSSERINLESVLHASNIDENTEGKLSRHSHHHTSSKSRH